MKRRWARWLLLAGFALLCWITYRFGQLGAFRPPLLCAPPTSQLVTSLNGPEDIVLDAIDSALYLSSQERHLPPKRRPDGSLYRLHWQEDTAYAKKLRGSLPEDFQPHGIDLWRSGDQLRLFVINQRQQGPHSVEVFDVQQSDSLIHRHSWQSRHLVWGNDVLALDSNRVLLTNVSRFGRIDAFLGLRGGALLQCTAGDFKVLQQRLAYPNGICLRPRDSLIAVSETLGGRLRFYRWHQGQLQEEQSSRYLHSGLDNVSCDAAGNFYVAQHQNLRALQRHLRGGSHSPSRVLGISSDLHRVDTLLCSNGNTLSGISTALTFRQKLWLGTVRDTSLHAVPLSSKDAQAMTAYQWRTQGTFFDVKGQRLFLAEAGAGTPLLLLHAYPIAPWGWYKLWDSLQVDYLVLAPDLPGSGWSDKPSGRQHYRIDALTNAVEGLLQARGIDSVHVLASGYGCSVAQELLARQVNDSASLHLRSLCFVGGALFPEQAGTTTMQRFLLHPAGAFLSRYLPKPYSSFAGRFARNFGSDHPASAHTVAQVWSMIQYDNGLQRVPETLQYLRDRRSKARRFLHSMQHSPVPIGLINSKTDMLTGTAMTSAWQDALPERPIYLLEGNVGHYPGLEVPGQVLQRYRLFVQEQGSRQTQ